jgi:DHA1 family bicyclomycin/chloramphenicol resistance-like MFS transporter
VTQPGPAPRARLLTALLAACTAVGPVSTLVLLPALPEIRAEFGASTAATQSTVSSFLVAFALGIPFAGPLSDRFGRRPLLLGGLLLFALGSALAAFAPTLEVLVAARIIQALGGAANLTVARAVVGDLYHDWRLPKALAQLTMVMMLATTIAPWLGAVVTESLGWHAPFMLLLGFAGIVFVAVQRLLPETRVPRADAPGPAAVARASLAVLRNPRFVGCAIDSGVVYALFLGFISVAPYIMSEMLDRPATDFGVYVLLLSAGYFLGNLYVARQAQVLDMGRIARIGTIIQFASALVALGFVAVGFEHPLFWFAPQLPLAFAQGLIIPHVTAVAVRMVPGQAGLASSLLGFSQQFVAAIVVQALGFLPTHTPLPMLAVCAVLAFVSLAGMIVLRKAAEQGVSPR